MSGVRCRCCTPALRVLERLSVPRRRAVHARAARRRADQPQLPGAHARPAASTSRGSPARRASCSSIDRDAEAYNSRRRRDARDRPAGRRVRPRPTHVLVVDWIDGRHLHRRRRSTTRTCSRASPPPAARCTRARASSSDFDMFDVQRDYLQIVRERRLPAARRTISTSPTASRARRGAARVEPSGTVACHNDLLAANIMDDGARVWLIDYEYSGNNDPCFELGNIWSEAEPARSTGSSTWSRATTARRHRSQVARARLFATDGASTAGRCGPRSRTPSARSTSTSGRGAWRSTTGRSRSSAARSCNDSSTPSRESTGQGRPHRGRQSS